MNSYARFRVRLLALVAAGLIAPSLAAQTPASADATALSPPAFDGAPVPVPPAVASRDARGKITLRAVRLDRPLQLDGRLDEAIYRETLPIDQFEQQVPREAAPATERTQAWILFDDENLYFCARLLDSQSERIVANEMRHDSVNIFNGGDSMTLVLDTFYDHRNGVLFQTNPLGAQREQAIADGQYIESWNTVWDVKSARIEGGWSTEMAIPFKSLRFREAGPQIWGINFRRVIRWKNEYAGVTPMPAAFGGSGLAQMQMAATLVGLSVPTRTRSLELKPYAVAASTTDLTAAQPFRNDGSGDVGVDVKYGLSRGLTADLTVNTDFAQIEEDLQQINLTRFNLLFPEKRDFFLEGQGIFSFGGRSLSGRGSGGDSDDVPIMFFSRQIGLARGRTIPVLAGARVTGKAGAYDIAALNIETAKSESAGVDPANFTAVRVRRDILRRSNVGVIATARRPGADGGTSLLAGADASFRLSQNNTLLGYYARTDVRGSSAQAASYRARFDYAGDRYGASAEHLLVAAGFSPEVGYARRDDFRRNTGTLRFSPRLRGNRYMRQLTWVGTYTYDTDAGATRVENRSIDGGFRVELHSGDIASLQYVGEYELLPGNFRIDPRVTVPQGGYDNRNLSASYSLANNRPIAGRIALSTGAFYDGTRREASYSGRVAVMPQFAVEPSVSLAWVRLPYGDFDARLIANRFTYTPTTRLFVSSLIQFNVDAKTLSSSLRFRWEYRPGSDLFLVYSDGRDTSRPGTAILNRSLAFKMTRLVRF
ncbi:MAG TPA: DUF5916 domain-containing protein [Vicinamibacterales bacterium]|nr:DUF5916 domain-containing protein [Vicinamibacterales bacterium]